MVNDIRRVFCAKLFQIIAFCDGGALSWCKIHQVFKMFNIQKFVWSTKFKANSLFNSFFICQKSQSSEKYIHKTIIKKETAANNLQNYYLVYYVFFVYYMEYFKKLCSLYCLEYPETSYAMKLFVLNFTARWRLNVRDVLLANTTTIIHFQSIAVEMTAFFHSSAIINIILIKHFIMWNFSNLYGRKYFILLLSTV